MDRYGVSAFPHTIVDPARFTAHAPCPQLSPHTNLLPTTLRENERHFRKKVLPSLRLCHLWHWLSLLRSSEEHEPTHCCKSKISHRGRDLDEAETSLKAFAGIGGGGMTTVVSIIMSDIVPLRERGVWQGIINIIYALGAGCGAPLGMRLVFSNKSNLTRTRRSVGRPNQLAMVI